MYGRKTGKYRLDEIKIMQWEEENIPLPKSIREMPSLEDHEEFYYKAFNELHTCRNQNMCIPWDSINLYAVRYDIDDFEDFEFFSIVIQTVDEFYREWMEKQRESAKK